MFSPLLFLPALLAALFLTATVSASGYRSSVFFTPSTKLNRSLPVFDTSAVESGIIVLSPEEAANLYAYLTGSSRNADLSSVPTVPQPVLAKGSSWLFNGSDDVRHIMFEAEGLEPADWGVQPSFEVAGDNAFVVSQDVANHVNTEYSGATNSNSKVMSITVPITDLSDILKTVRMWSEADNKVAPRFTSVLISGIDSKSPEYQSQLVQIKQLMENMSTMPNLSTSLVVRAADPNPLVSASFLTATNSNPEPSPNSNPEEIVFYPNETECNDKTQSCSGRGTCKDSGDSKWACQCNPGYLGNGCTVTDVTTELWLTFGVAVALIAVAVGGIMLLASAAPLDPASAVGVAHGPGVPAPGLSSTRAD